MRRGPFLILDWRGRGTIFILGKVWWRLADVLIAREKFEEAETQLAAARFGFNELLGKHLLAFADHAAEPNGASGR
jgi:hypothetical protein